MTNDIMKFATAIPDKGRAHEVRTLYNAKLKTSLSKLLDAAERGLRTDLGQLREHVDNLPDNQPIHPAWYDAHHNLKAALKGQNVAAVREILGYAEADVAKLVHPQEGSLSFDTIDRHPWQKEVLKGFRTETFGLETAGEIAALTDEELTKHRHFAETALSVIQAHAPTMADEIACLVNNLCLFAGAKADRGMVGGSDVRVYGEVYLRINDFGDDDVAYYAEHLVHEDSHLYMHALMASDPLILNDKSERYPAPIRPDLRPMYGIYHATFVLSRMVKTFHAIGTETDNPAIWKALETFQRQFRKGYGVVSNHAKMTPAGNAIVESYGPFLDGIV